MTKLLSPFLTKASRGFTLSKPGLLVLCQSQKIPTHLINLLFFCSLFASGIEPAAASDILGCKALVSKRIGINNNAVVSYSDRSEGNSYQTSAKKITTTIEVTNEADRALKLVSQGVTDTEGNSLAGLGAIAKDLNNLFVREGLNLEQANLASLATISQLANLPPEATALEVAEAIKESAVSEIENADSQEIVRQIPDSSLLTTLAGLQPSNLQQLGLSTLEIEAVGNSNEIISQAETSFRDLVLAASEATAQALERPEAKTQIAIAQEQYQQELDNIRRGEQSVVNAGNKLRFKFRLDNQQDKATEVELPKVAEIAEDGLNGNGRVTGISYRLVNTEGKREAVEVSPDAGKLSIPQNKSLELVVKVEVGEVSTTEISALEINLQTDCGTPAVVQTASLLPLIAIDGENTELIDPLGQITGCAGELLPEYRGFSVALYDPDPTDTMGSSIQNITPLTPTELPDDPNNKIPEGIRPNTENSNPFFLTNTDNGNYSFLFDEALNQLDKGQTYILLVSPPEDSIYSDRRIRLTIGDRNGNIVEYTATSLDGKPISTTNGETTVTGEIVLVQDAERVGLDLAVLDLATNVCDAREIQITKTGDRATAEPGDIVLYRLAIRNLASAPIDNIQITDFLPSGFKFESDSVKAELDETPVAITTSQQGRTVSFSSNITLETGQVVNLVYAAQLTPNALRGDGQNRASVTAQRTVPSGITVQDGPAIHDLTIDPGILEDTGTLIGRVFVDRNFDGQQQSGEPGIPNAVIFLEDGNRIITDPDGLFSVTNILPGMHTGVLDLTSIPEYRLAPNIRFSEGNSKSRLVRLEPGGMVRMNFGVTPTAATDKKPQSRRKIPSQRQQNADTPPPPKNNLPTTDVD